MRVALLCAVLALTGLRPQTLEPKLRVGVYDPRAIAVAYAPSRFNPVAQKVAERDAAEKAGDKARVKELEAWGERHQRELHRQAFAGLPVGNLLETVKGGVARVAAEQHLAVVTQRCDYSGPAVEVVDVTDALVLLFEPTLKTLETVASVRKSAPIELDEVEHDH